MIKFKNKNTDRIVAIMDDNSEEPIFVTSGIDNKTIEDKKEVEEDVK